MKKTNCVATWIISRFAMAGAAVLLAACAETNRYEYAPVATPTVDYVERLDVYSAPHQDSFLNQLAMNYRSYAIYNARTSGYPDMGELFAQKAVAAFSGELPFPESLENWPIENEQESFELYTAYNQLMDQLKNDASETQPQLAAEAQAKFDCWLSAAASGQNATARECRDRFEKTLTALRDCRGGKVIAPVMKTVASDEIVVATERTSGETYYPETRNLQSAHTSAAREGIIIVNNVNVPEHLINPVPVQATQPLVFNQNIYGGDKKIENSNNVSGVRSGDTLGEEFVTREEFINMMMAMRSELAAINARLDKMQAGAGEKTMIKVQQIPLEPKQHVMEEVFEVRFDFNKSVIKPEYQELIKKLATATQENKNIKVSVVGHTDTMGSKNYNYALGGRRAEAVQKMLIQYGIPASQIVAVSAGEEDLAVPTPDGVANAANRRVRVVKEVHYTEDPAPAGAVTVIEKVSEQGTCDGYDCREE